MSICDHAKIWNDVKVEDEDGNPYINSNYGYYIFKKGGFGRVFDELVKDKDSRRASIAIFGSEPEHFLDYAKDVPCTYSLNFRIRNNRLNMSVHMRSQDAVFGMGNDAPCFSFIHEMLFAYLSDVYPELVLGDYYHTADSFHVYERHFKMLEHFVADERDWKTFKCVECPKISSYKEAAFLFQLAFDPTLEIPTEYKFAKWLMEN
jgi:thymidylate synthase